MTISFTEKSKLPYSLLLDPWTMRAAAYTNTHQLVAELASEKLVQFALANTYREVAFERKLHQPDSGWRQLPAWATEDVLDRMKIVWIKRPDGEAPDAEWLAIPKR